MNSPNDHTLELIVNNPLGGGLHRLVFRSTELAASARPGQFVMVSAGPDNSFDPLLRRPLSIHDLQGERLSLLFKVVGRGTARLAAAEPGRELKVLGPLGRGFPDLDRPTLIIGGGLGIAPLLFLTRANRGKAPLAVRLGAASKDQLAVAADFQALAPAELFTEDGSLGARGLVTDGLAEELTRPNGPQLVLACGPEPMLKSVARICGRAGVECRISLEARMACGLGACLGCSHEAADGSRRRVCLEGPVFEAKEIFNPTGEEG